VGTLTLAAHAAIGETLTLSIRPEQIALGRAVDGATVLCSARVAEVSFQGTHLRAHLRAEAAGDTELLLRAPATAGLALGDLVELSARPADVVWLRR
jgi:ABC-type Fe3+/spermidine/putrescine transport system ATPase subunit